MTLNELEKAALIRLLTATLSQDKPASPDLALYREVLQKLRRNPDEARHFYPPYSRVG